MTILSLDRKLKTNKNFLWFEKVRNFKIFIEPQISFAYQYGFANLSTFLKKPFFSRGSYFDENFEIVLKFKQKIKSEGGFVLVSYANQHAVST